jgi:hypothetical protein
MLLNHNNQQVCFSNWFLLAADGSVRFSPIAAVIQPRQRRLPVYLAVADHYDD